MWSAALSRRSPAGQTRGRRERTIRAPFLRRKSRRKNETRDPFPESRDQ
jgi:hypothetical protein